MPLWPFGAFEGMVGAICCGWYWTILELYACACIMDGAPFMCEGGRYCGCDCMFAPSKCWIEGRDMGTAPGGEPR